MERVAGFLARLNGWIVRTWFWCTFLVGIAFLAFMPPFQTNDETHHWSRLYSVMLGQYARGCVPIPHAADDLVPAFVSEQIRHGWKWEFRRLDDGLALDDARPVMPTFRQACNYPTVGYLFPALLARVGQKVWPTEWGRVVLAFYLARLGNWLMLTLAVWLGLRMLPRLRTWLVLVYSVPMVIHQAASINQDSIIVALHILLLILLWRARPIAKLLGIVVITYLLDTMKPVFQPYFILTFAPLWELAAQLGERRRKQIFGGALALAGLVLLTSPLWIATLLRHTLKTMPAVAWADSQKQTELIIAQPSILYQAFKQQLADNLGHGHLVGGFTSIIGVFGWAQYEVPCYPAVLTALVLALFADMLSTERPEDAYVPARGFLQWFWCRFAPAFVPLLSIFMIDLGFYVFFTQPGAPFIVGVQGRYYFGALLMMGAAIAWFGAGLVERAWARLRNPRPWLRTVRVGAVTWLTMTAFHEMLSAWRDSYDLISNTYFHHFAGW